MTATTQHRSPNTGPGSPAASTGVTRDAQRLPARLLALFRVALRVRGVAVLAVAVSGRHLGPGGRTS